MLINVNKVTHITIHPAVKSNYYFYKHKRWFFGLRPRGFYESGTLSGIPKRIKSLPDTVQFKNNYVLARFVEEGLLQKTPGGYRIADRPALQALADEMK